jgi:hypothetical protein
MVIARKPIPEEKAPSMASGMKPSLMFFNARSGLDSR